MDIQKEVGIFLEKIETINYEKIKLLLEETTERISKIENLKLYYKLIIKKIDKKIINMISDISDEEKQQIELEKYFKILYLVKVKNEKIKQIKENTHSIKNNESSTNKVSYIFEKVDEQNTDLTPIQEEIYEKMKDKFNNINYRIEDILISFSNLIKNINIVENEEIIINNSNIIYRLLNDYMYENKTIFDEFYYLVDVLNTEFKKYEKETKEREILKKVSKKIISIYNIYKNEIVIENTIPLFSVISYWLTNENSYLYIKELLKRKPEICNVHYNNEHIVIYILKQYIYNFKLMINDKNSEYINKNYLKEIYYLFTKSYHLKMSRDEKKIVDNMLYEFSNYIKENLIKEKRKNAALEEIKTLKSSNYYERKNEYSFQRYTFDNLMYEQNRIINNCKNYTKNKPYNDAFLIDDYAYSIETNDDEIILNMYAFDIHKFAPERSIMDNYLKVCEYQREEVDKFIKNCFKFKIDNIYPTICYSLLFNKSGKIKGLRISSENIKITDKYSTFGGIRVINEFYDLYQKSIVKNNGVKTDFNLIKINEHFNDLLNKEFLNFSIKNKLPIIYYGCKLPDIEEINFNINTISPLLYNLDKCMSYEIINIVSSKIDKMHYSIDPIIGGYHDFKLIDAFNYIGLEHQRIIGILYFNEYNYEQDERIKREKNIKLNKLYTMVTELNECISYVDVNEIKESKGKIKRRIKL